MDIKIKPVGERIVIKPVEQKEQKTVSGIYLPDSAKKDDNSGEVVAIGKIEDVEVKIGDKVIYSPHSGTEIEMDGEKFIILEKNEILAII